MAGSFGLSVLECVGVQNRGAKRTLELTSLYVDQGNARFTKTNVALCQRNGQCPAGTEFESKSYKVTAVSDCRLSNVNQCPSRSEALPGGFKPPAQAQLSIPALEPIYQPWGNGLSRPSLEAYALSLGSPGDTFLHPVFKQKINTLK